MTGDMTNSDFSGTERPCGLTQLEDDSSSSRGAVVAASASAGDQQAAETHPVPDIANMPQAVEWLRKAGMWSVGSAKHGSGLCRPCHYCHTKDGCRAGEDCQFCHLPHTSVDQKRPCRARRRQCRIIADIVKDSGEDLDHGEYVDVIESIGSKSTYMQKVLKTKRNSDDTDGRDIVSL
eukprot:CAMPEP_0172685692 /NCGR_PEP_ID=MMETSP1074-20121228/20426_1 /TAXON_ID=2916 /ORGANISM="Ceratium fusus, Strain PA161109" /LENGTH=177 /DNA_ID=CAMNT_0013504883 /DNA_START=29 /DNA_END=562 /DNA_ORIENTATION=-